MKQEKVHPTAFLEQDLPSDYFNFPTHIAAVAGGVTLSMCVNEPNAYAAPPTANTTTYEATHAYTVRDGDTYDGIKAAEAKQGCTVAPVDHPDLIVKGQQIEVSCPKPINATNEQEWGWIFGGVFIVFCGAAAIKSKISSSRKKK